MEEGDAPEHEVGVEHENFAVCEINKPQDAVHHGVADGDEGVQTAQGQAVQNMLDKDG